MAAQTVTDLTSAAPGTKKIMRMSKRTISKLANLQREFAGAATVDVDANTTTTITLVYTTATGIITIDYAST